MKNLILPLLWLGGFLLISFVTWPGYQALQAQKKQVERSYNMANKAQAQYEELDEIERSSAEVFEEALSRIPLENEQENLMRDLQKISQENGFFFRNLAFSLGLDNEINVSFIRVAFSVTGERAQLIRFLKRLELNDRFFRVDDVSLEGAQSANDKQVTMNLSVFAYFQQDEK